MYKFTLRQKTSRSDHIRSRANVMIRCLMQRNSPDPNYHNFTFDEAGERVNMTGKQIPEFIQHLESDNVNKRTQLCIKELINKSETTEMLEYLRTNRDQFLQLASRVVRKNPTETLQEHMCATLCLLVRLISTDAEGIIDSIGNDTIFAQAIINLLKSYDVYSNTDFVNYLSAFLNAVLDRINTGFESKWRDHLSDLRNMINQQLSRTEFRHLQRVAERFAANNLCPANMLQDVLVSLRTLLNLNCMQLTQTNNDFLREILEVNEISNTLRKLFNVMINIFRVNIQLEENVNISQWSFIESWLSVMTFIRRLDIYNVESQRDYRMLFDENSTSFLKTMDIMYKIVSEFNTQTRLELIHQLYNSEIMIQTLRKTLELLVLYCNNIGVPVTLSIMLLSVFHHINKEYNKKLEENKLIKDYLSDSLVYWTFILDKCTWLHVMGILDLCPTESRIFALKKAIDCPLLSAPRKVQLMKIYSYTLI